MTKPDASRHDPRPEYLRALIAASGLSQQACARAMNIDPSMLRRYLADGVPSARPAPYLVQHALESFVPSGVVAELRKHSKR